jgi:hypothetical protein
MSEVDSLILHENKLKPGNPNWLPGQSGNPRGRPPGSRQKIAEQLLTAFASVLDEDPVTALRALRADDPGKFWSIAAGLLPRETLVSVQQAVPGNLAPHEWAQVVRVLDLIKLYAPAGADPLDVFTTIEKALIAAYEKVIPAPPY